MASLRSRREAEGIGPTGQDATQLAGLIGTLEALRKQVFERQFGTPKQQTERSVLSGFTQGFSGRTPQANLVRATPPDPGVTMLQALISKLFSKSLLRGGTTSGVPGSR